jgi:stage IV sporulation protein FB
MILSEPGQTPYDIRFSLFGFPVRVHPLFFVLPLLLSGGAFRSGMNVGVTLLVVTAVFFVSLLVHELGHSFAFRRYGVSSNIVLYLMGGLAVPSGFTSWRGSRQAGLTPQSLIVISLAGPFAGFALAGVLAGIGLALGAEIVIPEGGLPLPYFEVGENVATRSPALWMFLNIGLWVNLFWNLLNLAPVFPLDGGQVSQQLFLMSDPYNGLRNSLVLSIIVAALIAVWGFSNRDTFMGLMFGMMAFNNYQMLSMMGGGGGRW